jgi:beta-phosphoglucomutase
LRPTALIFDMDGVLVDSEALHERSKREAFRRAGITLPEERFAAYIGRSDKAMIDDLASEFSLSVAQSAEIQRQKNAFYETFESTLRPVSGALDFVRWSHRHFRLALATSATARNRRFLLKMFAIESLFEVVVDAAQFKVPKPSPEVFEITLKKLSLEPTACWIIEDSINGLIAARQAGCFAVGITTSFSSQTLRDAGADLVVESFAQLHSRLAGAPPRFPNSR